MGRFHGRLRAIEPYPLRCNRIPGYEETRRSDVRTIILQTMMKTSTFDVSVRHEDAHVYFSPTPVTVYSNCRVFFTSISIFFAKQEKNAVSRKICSWKKSDG